MYLPANQLVCLSVCLSLPACYSVIILSVCLPTFQLQLVCYLSLCQSVCLCVCLLSESLFFNKHFKLYGEMKCSMITLLPVSLPLVNFCRTTVPLLLGVAQALGVSSVYVSDPLLITQLLFPNHSGQATPKEPQLPRALSRSAPRRFLSFPQGKRDDSYHFSDEQLNNLITKVSSKLLKVCIPCICCRSICSNLGQFVST